MLCSMEVLFLKFLHNHFPKLCSFTLFFVTEFPKHKPRMSPKVEQILESRKRAGETIGFHAENYAEPIPFREFNKIRSDRTHNSQPLSPRHISGPLQPSPRRCRIFIKFDDWLCYYFLLESHVPYHFFSSLYTLYFH